ncbi:sensor histidine kinase [Trichocoleus sp. FACHB-262]|uniref:sensor histidine kinase n=1 Tax=Trichocoleus sp. FACHB-262 TaxID=2692869 RepID=UPI0016821B85|nr:ATP-binding protein [Trichocoleus sp. FACHB-262]MBD2122920.1 sensor histidine kinase [Trichocoleus sp. FACHB-262]
MLNQSSSHFIPPSLSEGNGLALSLESPLQDLRLYSFQVELSHLGSEIAHVFEKTPLLPGVILLEQGEFVGMISRQQFLEYLLRPQGLELFLNQPLSVLYSYARTKPLVLSASTPIVTAAQQALRRSRELLGEPIVVYTEPQTYQLLNMHELNIAYWQIRGIETQVRYERAQAQMIQTEKMASLGRLVDGIAHEILDPVSFIWGNLTHVSSYSQNLLELIAAYQACLTEPPEEILNLQEDLELDYVIKDLPHTIASIRSGAERLSKLATSLQNFCHIDEVYPKPADLHECLDNILLLLKSRLTGEIQIVRNYGQLPPVSCFSGQLSQVFMNILTNAVDALIDQAVRQELAIEYCSPGILAPPQKPQIEITTQVCPAKLLSVASGTRWVSVKIADNGPGLAPEQHQRILESFSVEKRAAKETSLSMSYQIVTARHGGKFELRSQLGVGTEFTILLPLV